MEQMYAQVHIPGGVLTRKEDPTGTAVVTLFDDLSCDINSWKVSIQMDGSIWMHAFCDKYEAEKCFINEVRRFYFQAEFFGRGYPCYINMHH